jgi:hypothetical protein
MSEHQLPEPDPEPLGAYSLEDGERQSSGRQERQRLLTSMVDAVEYLVEREDGIRKNTFVFRKEKILSCPEGDAYPNGCKVHLSFYTFSGLPNVPVPTTDRSPAKKYFDQEYKDRRFAGIDVVAPIVRPDSELVDYSIKRYQIVADEKQGIALKQYFYSKKHDADIPRNVNDETLAELCGLLQSFLDEGGGRLDVSPEALLDNETIS